MMEDEAQRSIQIAGDVNAQEWKVGIVTCSSLASLTTDDSALITDLSCIVFAPCVWNDPKVLTRKGERVEEEFNFVFCRCNGDHWTQY